VEEKPSALVQGTVYMLILKTVASNRCTGTASVSFTVAESIGRFPPTTNATLL
jgi:hypothetical protein